MKQMLSSLDTKLSAFDTNQEDVRESLKSVAKMSEVKHIFDTFMQYQQESLRQQQQETLRHREQQQQQLQLQQTLLQQQQYLLQQQQQQLSQQQRQLENIALHQQTLMIPVVNQASAPPMSIEADEFLMSLHGKNGMN
jgi:multidrug efflux pump subunit AcrA (membrane-fusion protein)